MDLLCIHSIVPYFLSADELKKWNQLCEGVLRLLVGYLFTILLNEVFVLYCELNVDFVKLFSFKKKKK